VAAGFKMKVLHVIPSIAPVRGGPSYAVLAMVKALRLQGIDAEIATTNDNSAELLDVPLYQRCEYEQVPVWFLPRFSPPMKEFIFSAALTQWLWQHMRDYDILHTHYIFSYPSTCAGVIARYQGIPYVVRTIGQLTPWALAQSQQKKQIYSCLIERHNLNSAAAIHCTSTGEAEDVRQFGIHTPTLNLPLGVNPAIDLPASKQEIRRVFNISPKTLIVLFLSRLHYKKRPDLLLHACSQLALQNYDFHIIFAGSGEPDYLTYLNSLVVSLNLTSRISMADFVIGRDKERLLQGADIFVLPSFSENFGVAVAEAISYGLPVIVTPDVQIAPEIAAAKAGLVIDGEVDALSSAIAQLLTSPDLRRQLGENGKRLATRRYSWNAIATNLIDAYTAIIQEQPLPNWD
jgi:glycosyltransferase involved in cell wall biosynthesis